MNRVLRPALVTLFVTFATHLGASTLSVVPLGDALQNPNLVDIDPDSETYTNALEKVTGLLLNQPEEHELAPMRERLSNLARYRDTRVGKLFFAALASTPAIENLPEGITEPGITASWPLALGASVRVRAVFRKSGESWLISEFELTVDGVAGAPIAGMAPYFGNGEIRPILLDLEAIDYVIGRDPNDRQLPESQRKPFDYDAALKQVFESEEGGVLRVLEELNDKVKPTADRASRVKALTAHLSTKEEVEAVKAADADETQRDAFWEGIYRQLKNALKTPRPAAVAKRPGARVQVRWQEDGDVKSLTALRLEPSTKQDHGEIALRGTTPPEKTDEEGNSSRD